MDVVHLVGYVFNKKSITMHGNVTVKVRTIHYYNRICTKPHSEWSNGIRHRAEFKVSINVSKKNTCFRFSGQMMVYIPSKRLY
jgi:hypothetical protein